MEKKFTSKRSSLMKLSCNISQREGNKNGSRSNTYIARRRRRKHVGKSTTSTVKSHKDLRFQIKIKIHTKNEINHEWGDEEQSIITLLLLFETKAKNDRLDILG